MFKERIVKFSDGSFGIQVKGGWFTTPEFLWLPDTSCKSSMKEHYFKKYCRERDFAKVKALFDKRQEEKKMLTFTPVKPTNLADHM